MYICIYVAVPAHSCWELHVCIPIQCLRYVIYLIFLYVYMKSSTDSMTLFSKFYRPRLNLMCWRNKHWTQASEQQLQIPKTEMWNFSPKIMHFYLEKHAKPRMFGENQKDTSKVQTKICFQIKLGRRQSITRSAAPAKSRVVNPGDANPYDSEEWFDLQNAGSLELRVWQFFEKNWQCFTESPLGCCFRCMVGDRNQNHSRNVLRQWYPGQFSLHKSQLCLFNVQTPKNTTTKPKLWCSNTCSTIARQREGCTPCFYPSLWHGHLDLFRGDSGDLHVNIIVWHPGWDRWLTKPMVCSLFLQLFFPCGKCLCCLDVSFGLNILWSFLFSNRWRWVVCSNPRVGSIRRNKFIIHLLCFWAYVSCHYQTHVHFQLTTKESMQRPHSSFWKWGNGCDTSHNRVFQAVGLAIHASETSVIVNWCQFNLYVIFWETGILERIPVWTDTRPRTLVRRHTCVNEKGEGDEKRIEWAGKKNRASKEAETSDNIQRGWTYLACQITMHVTCNAVSLDQLEPKNAHENLWRTGSCFCLNTKTHYGLKQIIVYHVYETTLIVLLGLR